MTSSIYALANLAAFQGLPTPRPAGGFFAVDGTVYPGAPFPPTPITNDGGGFWSGFSSGMVGGLINTQDGLWYSECIGYPAKTIPMWPSVQVGRTNLVASIQAWEAQCLAQYGTYLPITGSGYSQGSMVWDQVFLLDFLTEDGVLHYLLPYLYRIYQYGHIFRTPGIAWGNALAGLPQSIITDGVETGGIGCVLDLTAAQTNTPAPDGKPIVVSSANSGDIYTCCPTGTNPWSKVAAQGATGQLFFKIVMQPTVADVAEAVLVLKSPLKSIEEGINAGTFFAEGTNAPHYQYFPQMDACIGDMIALGNSLLS